MSFPPRGDEFYTQHPQEVYQGEWTNMKAQLGKPTGLALALLAALLATFLAMGVFSVAQANAVTPAPAGVFPPNTVAPGGEVVVTIAVRAISMDEGTLWKRCQRVSAYVSISAQLPQSARHLPGQPGEFHSKEGKWGATGLHLHGYSARRRAGGPHSFSGTFVNPGKVGTMTFSGRLAAPPWSPWLRLLTVAKWRWDGRSQPGHGPRPRLAPTRASGSRHVLHQH